MLATRKSGEPAKLDVPEANRWVTPRACKYFGIGKARALASVARFGLEINATASATKIQINGARRVMTVLHTRLNARCAIRFHILEQFVLWDCSRMDYGAGLKVGSVKAREMFVCGGNAGLSGVQAAFVANTIT